MEQLESARRSRRRAHPADRGRLGDRICARRCGWPSLRRSPPPPDEITAALLDLAGALRPAPVAVHLDGDDLRIEVRATVEQTSAPADEGDASARISLRLSEALKTDIESAARREAISVNSWLVRRRLQRAQPAVGARHALRRSAPSARAARPRQQLTPRHRLDQRLRPPRRPRTSDIFRKERRHGIDHQHLPAHRTDQPQRPARARADHRDDRRRSGRGPRHPAPTCGWIHQERDQRGDRTHDRRTARSDTLRHRAPPGRHLRHVRRLAPGEGRGRRRCAGAQRHCAQNLDLHRRRPGARPLRRRWTWPPDRRRSASPTSAGICSCATAAVPAR